MGDMFVGTSGFSFDDWIGEVYPAGIRKHEMLQCYERTFGFKALEVNYTYYSMPSIKTMESFAKRTSKDFAFVVKAFKGITHEQGGDFKAQCRLFQQGIAPLNGQLKALLFQFPYSFTPTDNNVDYLKALQEEFPAYNSVIEFRNVQWSDEKYLDVLRKLSFGYCIVDEPKLKGLLPFTPVLTSSTGYFRFHGRNRAWFNEPVNIRYDYLYSEKELEKFVAPIQQIAQKATTTFVFFNNCHAGKAVKNAQMLVELLKKGYA